MDQGYKCRHSHPSMTSTAVYRPGSANKSLHVTKPSMMCGIKCTGRQTVPTVSEDLREHVGGVVRCGEVEEARDLWESRAQYQYESDARPFLIDVHDASRDLLSACYLRDSPECSPSSRASYRRYRMIARMDRVHQDHSLVLTVSSTSIPWVAHKSISKSIKLAWMDHLSSQEASGHS